METLSTNIERSIYDSAKNLESNMAKLHGIETQFLGENSHRISMIEQAHMSEVQISQKVDQNTSLVLQDLVNTQPYNSAHKSPMFRTNQTSMCGLTMQITIRNRCHSRCKCQCHKMSQARTSSWMKAVVGTLFLQYQTSVLWGSPPCNEVMCRSRSATTVHFQFQFPSWLTS